MPHALMPHLPAGAYYVVERGSCSFVDKYTAVLAAGGAGMLLFDDQPGEQRVLQEQL